MEYLRSTMKKENLELEYSTTPKTKKDAKTSEKPLIHNPACSNQKNYLQNLHEQKRRQN